MAESREQPPPLVEAREVSKIFSSRPGLHSSAKKRWVRAVDRVSLSVDQAEIVGLVGESGCGKSTLGKLLIRLEMPTAGAIFYNNKNIAKMRGKELRKTRRSMQIIFQDPASSLNPRFTVRDTLAEAIRVHHRRIEKRDLNVRLATLLQMVGLPVSSLDRHPREFSGGERQRVAIARALAVEPRFIVADEPISALDLTSQAQIVQLIDDLRKELDVSFLLIAHDLDVVQHLCSRVAVMYLGRIVEIAHADDLFLGPQHPYTQALIASTLSTDPDDREALHILPGDPPSPQDPPKGCYFHPRCPLADTHCRLIEPQMRASEPGHFTKCHLVAASSGDE
ncbi:MAG: ABC transporter ATP-binding protein [Deltaproteobacteria bacterium]|nr:ABC transporter ATP-binding protein [Deltaproteobacteria bacterium]